MRDLFSSVASGVRKGAVVALRNQGNPPVKYVADRPLYETDTNDIGEIADEAYSAYGSVGTLFAIVSQIGNAVATAEWHLYQRTSTRDKKRRKEVLGHSFMELWGKPNDFYTGRFFRESVQQHMDLVGEGVIVLHKVMGYVLEMWCVRPDRIFPVKHPTRFLTGYIYRGPDGEEVPLTLDQVVHIKYPNPADPYRGLGAVQTVLNDIKSSQYAGMWNKNFFINGARPGGVIEVDYRMGDTEFNAFVARWRRQHQGVANAQRVAVLENAKWVDTSFSMEDMQFAELRNLPRELIREAFAFPKPMLGTVDDVNRANAEAGKEIMAEGQTIPRLNRWKDITNAFLLPQFANGKTLEIDYDDPTPTNHEAADRERNSQATAASALRMAGWHPDDILEAVGLPKMRYVGVPGVEGGAVSDENGKVDSAPANRVIRARATRTDRMPVIEFDGQTIELANV